MTKRKGPRDDGEDGDGYGYDPARKVVRDLFERAAERAEQDDRPARKLKDVVPKVSPVKKRLIDARVANLDAPDDERAYHHTVLCQTVLPYKETDLRVWEHENGNVALSLEAGRVRDVTAGKWIDLPLPFGEKPRLILIHLNSEAVRNQSPVIDVERSMTAFISSLGIDTNGRNIKSFKDQLARLSATAVRLCLVEEGRAVQFNSHLIGAFSMWFPTDDDQRPRWPSTVRLSDDYFLSLAKHAVPLVPSHVAALRHSAMALDIYTWLAQRLHRVPVKKPQFIPWAALHVQFGHGYREIRKFRAFFLQQLKQVNRVYPDARFETNGEGMTLRHSRPPVAKLQLAVGSGTVIEGKATEVPD